MKQLFNPKAIAVVGATEQQGKIGRILMENLLSQKKVAIYPVNPKRKKIFNLKCYQSAKEIEKPVDVAIIAIPAEFVLAAVEDCARKSKPINNIVVISAGFSESGNKGKEREFQLKQMAKKFKLKIIGPNCLGFVNTANNLNGSFASRKIPRGGVGVIAQSGAITTALIDQAKGVGYGFSKIATVGNKAQITETDFLDYFAGDKKTEIIVLYLEEISQGKKFRDSLAEAVKKKPVLIIKTGQSEKSRKAIQSHTGAMAGSAEVERAVIEESGGIFCSGLFELSAAIKFFYNACGIKNFGLVIVTNAGGPGVIATDLAGKAGLPIVSIDKKTKDELARLLPKECSLNNPVDLLGDAMEDRYRNAIETVSAQKSIGVILAIVTPQAQTPLDKIARVLVEMRKKVKTAILPVFMGGPALSSAKEVMAQNMMFNFDFLEEAIDSLKLWNDKRMVRALKIKNVVTGKNIQLIRDALKNSQEVLNYELARKLANNYGIRALESLGVEKIEDVVGLKLEYPVVLKIDSETVLHKYSEGGVVLDIKDENQLKKAINDVKKNHPREHLIVQEQIKNGLEIIIGIKNDFKFGQMMMVGMGGIAAEIFSQKILWSLPVTKNEIEKKLKDSLFEKIFVKQKISLSQLAGELEKVGKMAGENPAIGELDINPIIFYPDKNPITVDIKVILEKDEKNINH